MFFTQDTISIQSDDSTNDSVAVTDTDQTESESGPSVLISSDSDAQSEISCSKRKKTFQNKIANPAKKKPNDDHYDALINKAMSMIEQTTDELDLFGQFVASEMRQLPNDSIRRVVKSDIMKTLIHYSTPIENSITQNQMDAGFTSETLFVISDD